MQRVPRIEFWNFESAEVSMRRQILIDKFVQSVSAKTCLVTGVDDCNRYFSKPFHRFYIIDGVAVGKLV